MNKILEQWWRSCNGTGIEACSKCTEDYICSWHYARLEDLQHVLSQVRAKELRDLGHWCAENIDPEEDVPTGSPAEIVFGKVMRELYARANVLEDK